MYIRQTSRKNKNGTRAEYVQLAHNVWDSEAKYSKTKVIYSFGRKENLDLEALRRLADSISRFLPAEEALERKQQVADVTDFLFQSSKQAGGPWLFEQMWQKLGLDEILRSLFADRQHEVDMERLLFSMVVHRGLAPGSKLSMEEWVEHDVHIPGLPQVQSHQLYRAMDELYEVQASLEERVFDHTANLLNLDVDILYFDTTSSYFEVDATEAGADETLRRHGYSKDKRPDLTQIVIGLAVTRDGIPVRSWVWPGNTMDMSVIEEVKKDLTGWRLGRVMQVMDRGFSSEKNLRTLQRAGGHYIIGERMRAGKQEVKEALATRGRFHYVQENLEVKEAIIGDGMRQKRYVIAFNREEEQRDQASREAIVAQLEEELTSLQQTPEEAHHKKACALRSHPVYGRYLRQLKDGTLKIHRQAIREEAKYDGKYLIRTSDDTMSAEEIALGYKQLLQVEDAFRTLKTTLQLRPMYHRREERIRAHVTLCWLALLLIRLIERDTGATWPVVRREVQRMQVGHFTTPKGDIYRRTVATAKQKQYFKRLGINLPPEVMEINLYS